MKTRWIALLCVVCFAAGVGVGSRMGDAPPPPPETPRPGTPPPRMAAADTPRADASAATATKRLRPAKPAVPPAPAPPPELVDRLVKDAMQIDDEALRIAALEDVRAAISSSDPSEIRAGLTAFLRLQTLDFDKASYHDAILRHTSSGDPSIRNTTFPALLASGLRPGDDALIRAAARDGLGEGTSILLLTMEKGDLTGESGAIVRDLLHRDDIPARETLRGIWGGRFSPELEARIIALSREPATHHDAIYFALSTQNNKSAASVDRLIEELSDPDSHNNGGRAAWGLGYGVAPADHPRVADAALKIVATRNSGYLHQQAWSLVKKYTGPAQLPALKTLSAKPNLPAEQREWVDASIASLEEGGD
ncbi:MAG: hypothetical protein H7A49_00495 [Akkermansiaceae bacterium]|nr:hypothetical protein [Akkermansiaceae bacterium]MCP5542360.1 hypothetical protein [Akkermansiaceae bacterium]MCP5546105.1 hypothetical protein [Akkermansiaceae bacterium]